MLSRSKYVNENDSRDSHTVVGHGVGITGSVTFRRLGNIARSKLPILLNGEKLV